MKRSNLALAAGLVFTAAAIKLAFPAKSEKIIDSVQDTAGSVVAESYEHHTVTQPVTVTINAAEYFSEPASEAASPALPEAVEAAVETFHAQQEPFSGLDVPANVTYDFDMPSFTFVKPVSAAVSSSFGYRVHPLENLTKFHYGTDLAALSGDDIVSFAAGTVTEVGRDDAAGNFIRISHPDGYESMYAHCGTVYVCEGQKVSAGEKIALVGASGKVTGPHLHFELTHNKVYLNPEFLLAAV